MMPTTPMKPVAILLNLILLCMVVAACGPTARQKAISTTFASVNASAAGFATYSAQHQLDIVNAAKSKDDAQAQLSAFIVKRDAVTKLFDAAYYAIAAAAALQDDPKSIDNLRSAAQELANALVLFMPSQKGS